ncbi:MAG: hypothetical protein OEZ44_06810, partial [Candidatus Bathyarchaeota archaeon]|nr:hypothetical protein [Candidatus Bathyarchaeota archaeon]
ITLHLVHIDAGVRYNAIDSNRGEPPVLNVRSTKNARRQSIVIWTGFSFSVKTGGKYLKIEMRVKRSS